jgi:hypothetical protein
VIYGIGQAEQQHTYIEFEATKTAANHLAQHEVLTDTATGSDCCNSLPLDIPATALAVTAALAAGWWCHAMPSHHGWATALPVKERHWKVCGNMQSHMEAQRQRVAAPQAGLCTAVPPVPPQSKGSCPTAQCSSSLLTRSAQVTLPSQHTPNRKQQHVTTGEAQHSVPHGSIWPSLNKSALALKVPEQPCFVLRVQRAHPTVPVCEIQ